MSGSTYVQYYQDPELGPPVMHGPNSTARMTSFGAMLDNQTALMKAAAKVGGPDFCASVGASDALNAHGSDRMLPRGSWNTPGATDENDLSYAARLNVAWSTWETAGMPLGFLIALQAAGFPVEPTGTDYWTTGAFIINHNGRIVQMRAGELVVMGFGGPCVNRQDKTGAVSGTMAGWTLDAIDQFYARYLLLFAQDVPTLVNTAGNPVKACLNQIAQQWRPGGGHYVGCSIVPHETGSSVIGWPIGGTIGQAGTVFGANGARFIDNGLTE